jgi:galactonate dehydratase
LQLAASIPNFLCQEQVTLGDGFLKKPFVVRDGHIDLPTDPGLGIELDDDAMVLYFSEERATRNPIV